MTLKTKLANHPAPVAASLPNWKTALPLLGLSFACLLAHPGAAAGEETAVKPDKADSGPRGCSRPEWPKGALEAKRGGTTTLALLIGADGKVAKSKITKSSGYDDLDESARVSISRCTFDPGKMQGKAMPAWMQLQFVWTPE